MKKNIKRSLECPNCYLGESSPELVDVRAEIRSCTWRDFVDMTIIWTLSPYINSMYSVLRLQFEYRIWLTPTTPRALMVLIQIWLTPPTPRALTALLRLACSHLVTSLYLHLRPPPKYRTTECADKGTPHKVKPSPNHPQLWTSSELPPE